MHYLAFAVNVVSVTMQIELLIHGEPRWYRWPLIVTGLLGARMVWPNVRRRLHGDA